MKSAYAAGVAVVVSAFLIPPVEAQTKSAAPRAKRTFWMGPQTGSNIPVGSVEYGNTGTIATSANARLASDGPALRAAVAILDANAGTIVGGRVAVWDALYLQTKVPIEALQKQRATTNLSFGELLVANSLAYGSGKSFRSIVALRAETGGWSKLARDLKIDEQSLVSRARAASEAIKYAKSRHERGHSSNLDRVFHPLKIRSTGN